MSFQHFNPAV